MVALVKVNIERGGFVLFSFFILINFKKTGN